jgi:two-component system CheB/CheR fusion protein
MPDPHHGSDAAALSAGSALPRRDDAAFRETHDDGPQSRGAFPIVGVGASAGGLKALSSLFAEIPATIGMAFVVIQHLDPDHESQLTSILAKTSQLPVEEAVDGVRVQPNRVYVITPNTRLGIEAGILRISPRELPPRSHHVIDAFLRLLAADRPGSAIGVILSGTGTDGTLGLQAIKRSGGITFAQDGTAEFTGMPMSAFSNGHADEILSTIGIATRLRSIADAGFPQRPVAEIPPGAPHPDAGVSPEPPANDPEHYAIIIKLLQGATGIDFTHYRSTTILRRTMRRMSIVNQSTLSQYARYLADIPGEIDALARDILIHVTSFYRDHGAFEALKTVVFPALMDQRGIDSSIRLWIVGCSTGQEVYSCAMELVEHLAGAAQKPQIQIFATDISDWALAKARLGRYPDSIADDIPPDRLARYFTRDGQGYRIAKRLRDLCVFAKHDVKADIPFSHLDLISCRNVLIYLSPLLQQRVLPTFHFALKPGGFLLLGSSESIGRSAHLYQTIDEKNRLYRSITAPGHVRALPFTPQHVSDQPMPPPAQPANAIPSDIQRAADRMLLGRYAPPGVIVTEAMEVIQFRGHTSAFLEPAQGEATLNLLTMVPFAVAEALRDALGEAKRINIPVRRERITHRREQSFRDIAFEVIPLALPDSAIGYLILFEEQGRLDQGIPVAPISQPAASGAATGTGSDLPELQRIRTEVVQLRRELSAASDYVQALREADQALKAQLKDTQEEAQSSMEEFRSTNEELQTAKEEVESTNEELITINEELRSANEELDKASTELRLTGELTAAIVETTRYPLLVLTPNLSVERVNQAFLDAFGVTRQETIGKLVYDLGDKQWDIPELRRLLEDILASNSTFDDFKVTHDFRQLGRRTMLLNARRLLGEGEHSRLIVLVIADITEQERIKAAMNDAAIEQLRSNEELDGFAAVTSHDLQEPLRMMSSYSGLLESQYGPLLDDRARGYVHRITDGARRMGEMIEAILLFSRIGYDKNEMAMVNSDACFDDAMAFFTGRIEEAQATIIHGALPEVRADRVQLTRIFQNLMGNALKYRSDKRLLHVRVDATSNEREWVFTVADNGVGMEQSNYSRIFNLFERLKLDRQQQGSGIGLATCKKIVEEHKGRIWVESRIDEGTTFFFTIPR